MSIPYLLKSNNWPFVIDKSCLVYTEDDIPPEWMIKHFNVKLADGEYETIRGCIDLHDWPDKSLFVSDNLDHNQYDIAHYIGHTNCLGIKYRRNHLNDYLNCNWSVKTFHPYDKWDIANKPKCLIVSASYGSDKFVDKALELNIPIYYDRTDYWNANPKKERFGNTEDKLLKVADVITCSSRYLADITPNGIRIDNGAVQFNRIESKRENIAVYVGKEDDKVDDSLIAEWKQQYPDYEFISIGATIEGCRRLNHKPYQEMMKYLHKCKIGLLPLRNTEYCKAQFNLKYWDYKQAGLKVLLNLPYNYEDAVMRWWPEVCEEICKCYPMLH